MPYIERQNGLIVGVYANLQPGFAEEWLEDNDPEVIAFLNPPPPPYVLPVSVFWTRMTDEEAEDFDGTMATSSPLRLRRAFNSATSMTSETELFLFVRSVLVGSVSSTRADEIMAPSLDGTSSAIEAS